MAKLWLILTLLFFAGCAGNSGKMHISINVDSGHVLKIMGLDPDISGQFQRDSGAWQNLFPVYRVPADTDMKDFQRPQPGTYHLAGSAVIFTPDTPFIKGQTYFLRYYRSGEGKSKWNIIREKQKLGSQSFSDLNFEVNGK